MFFKRGTSCFVCFCLTKKRRWQVCQNFGKSIQNNIDGFYLGKGFYDPKYGKTGKVEVLEKLSRKCIGRHNNKRNDFTAWWDCCMFFSVFAKRKKLWFWTNCRKIPFSRRVFTDSQVSYDTTFLKFLAQYKKTKIFRHSFKKNLP